MPNHAGSIAPSKSSKPPTCRDGKIKAQEPARIVSSDSTSESNTWQSYGSKANAKLPLANLQVSKALLTGMFCGFGCIDSWVGLTAKLGTVGCDRNGNDARLLIVHAEDQDMNACRCKIEAVMKMIAPRNRNV